VGVAVAAILIAAVPSFRVTSCLLPALTGNAGAAAAPVAAACPPLAPAAESHTVATSTAQAPTEETPIARARGASPPGERIARSSLKPIDVFELELAGDPQISPDGRTVVYVRHHFDIMADRRRTTLWSIAIDGSNHRAITSGEHNDTSPRFSPDGTRLAYQSGAGGSPQIFVRWLDTGQTARVTHLNEPAAHIAWSPDGRWIAFTMIVRQATAPFAPMPARPKGAKWAPGAKVIDTFLYRRDGTGYLPHGFRHIFVVPADGGTPRQLTTGNWHDGAPSWTPDGRTIIFSANRRENWAREPRNSEVYEVDVHTGAVRALTSRNGPDNEPVVSPDGKTIAYTGFDDHLQSYEITHLYTMNRGGTGVRDLTEHFDRSVGRPRWAPDGKGVYVLYNDHGATHIGYVSLDGGKVRTVVHNVGGMSLGRPYPGGSFSVARAGRLAFNVTAPDHPADVATAPTRRGPAHVWRLTHLNDDLFAQRTLGTVEEIHYTSSFDGREIQGWIVKPPHFDAGKKYPLILEIHGGPFANYGARFSAEIQLYAAAGYVVLYTNPRGSTGYGGEFGNLIHHAYPGHDYDDLISGVDAVVAKGYVDSGHLYVTGGSGGGVLSAWIVGKTNRFRAAVVAKPVINWYSFVLTSDIYNVFYKYWFDDLPWNNPKPYLERSPISLVGNVKTPTMVMTGEDDHRTPISETEQFYQALRLRGVESVMVRIPETGHGITARPSHLIAKVLHVLEWFKRHGGEG